MDFFFNLAHFRKTERKINRNRYNRVYTDILLPHDDLEDIFRKFNTQIPEDFDGHSLSVSDILVISYHGEKHAYFCDSVGFEEIPEFLEAESGY